MFEQYIERPIFNLLELIYAIVPGHDLGVSIIIFTVLIRLALWPIVKKQTHNSKVIRRMQPKLKAIKKEAKGDIQKQRRLQLELYKEHGIKPASTFVPLLIQLPIFTGLYFAIRKLINDPNSLQTFSYDFIHELPWIKNLSSNFADFDPTLFGLIDLTRAGISSQGVYVGAVILVAASAVVQYYQSKLMLPESKDAKKLSDILRDASEGKEADQSDVQEAVSRTMVKIIPFGIFVFTMPLPSAMALYFLTSAAVGYAQQKYILDQDSEEMEEVSDEPIKEEPKKKPNKTKKAKKSSKSATQRKKRKRR